jgi:LmbE family N-acetylglucosaminyl deacetylase
VRRLKGRVQRAGESLWCAGFRLIRRARQPEGKELGFDGGAAVLVVAPHPDDEVAGCGGTIVRHTVAGDRVTIVYVTDGRRSRALGLPAALMAEARQREAGAAATVLGVDRSMWLGLPEGAWRDSELERRLARVLDEVAPAIVYAPSRVDFHPEHAKVAHALAAALTAAAPAGRRPVIRIFQVQVPLGAPLVNRWADVSGHASVLRAAVAAHASQVGSLERCLRMRRYAACRRGAAALAEEFWEINVDGYVALHGTPPAEWQRSFRALRYFVATDPCAYLVGGRARRRLLDLISRTIC